MDVVVPDLGDFADVEIIEILVKPGDDVAPEQGLVTLETEKATMDVPSPAAGRVGELKVKVGDRVSKGDVILSLATDGAGAGAARVDRAEDDKTVRQPQIARSGGDDKTVERPKAARVSQDMTVEQPKVVRPPDDSTVRQPKSAPAAAAQTIVVPDLGDFADVEVIDVLVKPGDEVAAEQGLVTLETEKASMDVPAPLAGTVLEVKVKKGSRVSAGDPVAVLRPSSGGRVDRRCAGGGAASVRGGRRRSALGVRWAARRSRLSGEAPRVATAPPPASPARPRVRPRSRRRRRRSARRTRARRSASSRASSASSSAACTARATRTA